MNETKANLEAYLCGVLHGDGWCTHHSLALRVADYEFAEAFAFALRQVFSMDIRPALDERGYWLVRKSNTTGKYDYLLKCMPQDSYQMAAWLRGLFDSEGNATLRLNGVSENSYGRGIEMFSTSIATLARALGYLDSLGIPAYLRYMKKGEGHKGKKEVYRLTVKGKREYYARFPEIVGSNIPRKQQVLLAIPQSYRPDMTEHFRAAQRKGVATKHRKFMEEKVPAVLSGIRELVQKNIKPTQQNCQVIPGFTTIRQHFRLADLISLALNDELREVQA